MLMTRSARISATRAPRRKQQQARRLAELSMVGGRVETSPLLLKDKVTVAKDVDRRLVPKDVHALERESPSIRYL